MRPTSTAGVGAVRSLTPGGRDEHHRGMRALTGRTVDLLRAGPGSCRSGHGDGGDEGACSGTDCRGSCRLSPERVTLSVLAGMVNSELSEEDGYTLLTDPAHVGGRFLQRMHARNPGRARAWFHRQWGEARRWVAEHPAHDPLQDSYELTRVRAALEEGEGFSCGQAGVTERAVLRYLLDRGLKYSSVIVRASLRQISESTCAHLATVHRTVARLVQAGWIEVYEVAKGYRATSYRIRRPDAVRSRTEVPLFMGGKGTPVRDLPGAVHPLFAGQGLGRGVQETFAHLPLHAQRAKRAKGLVLVAVDRRLPAEVKRPPRSEQVWPLVKAPRGPGRSAVQIARVSGKSVETDAHRGSRYAESTVRTMVTSHLCANAPDHASVTYRDFERVGHGLYRLSQP